MCVDNCSGVSDSVGQHEEGRALALGQLFVFWGLLQVLPVNRLDKQVIGQDTLLLYSRGGYVDLIAVTIKAIKL